jgi:predicted GIY-YIG superfamily endonuclease
MTNSKRKNWSKSECQIEALKYKTRNEFIAGNRKAYRASSKKGWLDEICIHMKSPYKINYWTKERCAEIASKCSSRKEFQKKSRVAYNKSLKNDWLDEICSHMSLVGNLYKRSIYAIEFPDNKVYVGLSYNIKKRFTRHLTDTNSSVYKHIKLSGITPIVKQLTDYLDIETASKLEIEKSKEYIRSGRELLNVSKCGNLGGRILKWTKEICQLEALRYAKRNEFKVNSPLAYGAARRNKWLDEICKHMEYAYKNHKSSVPKGKIAEEILDAMS